VFIHNNTYFLLLYLKLVGSHIENYYPDINITLVVIFNIEFSFKEATTMYIQKGFNLQHWILGCGQLREPFYVLLFYCIF